MGIEEMVTLFSNGVFPIVMCVVLCYYINTTQTQLTSAIQELRETMLEIKQQMKAIKDED